MSKFPTKKFVAHVELFMNNLNLRDSNKKNIVAVSGGVDSLALMYVLNDIFNGHLTVLHINHGTRPENKMEENLV